MNLRGLASEATSPTAWYIAAGIAVMGFCFVLALAGPLAKL